VEQPDPPDFLALHYTVLDLVQNLTEKLGPRTMAGVFRHSDPQGKLRLLCTWNAEDTKQKKVLYCMEHLSADFSISYLTYWCSLARTNPFRHNNHLDKRPITHPPSRIDSIALACQSYHLVWEYRSISCIPIFRNTNIVIVRRNRLLVSYTTPLSVPSVSPS